MGQVIDLNDNSFKYIPNDWNQTFYIFKAYKKLVTRDVKQV